MPIHWIAILLFFLGAVIFAILQRNNFLEKLSLEPDEVILFDDQQAKFKAQGGAGRWTMYPWGYIRVTNRRMFFAQGGILGKRHVLRFIVRYDSQNPIGSPSESPGEILKSGRQEIFSDRSHLRWDQEKDKTILRIFPRDEDIQWFQISELLLYPGTLEPYQRHLLH